MPTDTRKSIEAPQDPADNMGLMATALSAAYYRRAASPIHLRIFELASEQAHLTGAFTQQGLSLEALAEPVPHTLGHTARELLVQQMIEEVNPQLRPVETREDKPTPTGIPSDRAQILDVGAGLNGRDPHMAANHPRDITVVELDLPFISGVKKTIVNRLMQEGYITLPEPPNLHIEPGNALDHDRLLHIDEAHFDPKLPLTIAVEGLVAYLSRDELQTFCENARDLLSRHRGGGYLLTELHAGPSTRGNVPVITSNLSKVTGIDTEANRLGNSEIVRAHLAGLGFEEDRPPATYANVAEETLHLLQPHLRLSPSQMLTAIEGWDQRPYYYFRVPGTIPSTM